MFLLTLSCQAEPSKVMSLNFDDTANVVYINLMESTQNIERELKFSKLENRRLPEDIDYTAVTCLRLEARQKLQKLRPANIGQASRISGVSPADIATLMVYLNFD